MLTCPNVVSELSKSCLKFFPKLSQIFPKVASELSKSYLKVVPKLSQIFLKVVSKLSKSCLKVVSDFSQSCLRVVPKLCKSEPNFVSKSQIKVRRTVRDTSLSCQSMCDNYGTGKFFCKRSSGWVCILQRGESCRFFK